MRTIAMAWALTLVACGGDKEEETPTETTPVEADCGDSAYNPWAGTCVETFHADCWDPEGTCNGTVELTGATYLEWENGAAVDVTLDFASDPFNPGAITDLIASDGTVCSTGVSRNNEMGCASRTVYTRVSDGATMVFCIQADQSMEVTCPDGSTVSATAAQSEGAQTCQYGDAEPCTIDTPEF